MLFNSFEVLYQKFKVDFAAPMQSRILTTEYIQLLHSIIRLIIHLKIAGIMCGTDTFKQACVNYMHTVFYES